MLKLFLIFLFFNQLVNKESGPYTTDSCCFIDTTRKTIWYEDDFSDDLQNWIVEQVEGGITYINKNNELEIDDIGGCTIWFKHKLKAPILIEFEVTLIHRNGENDRVSDLNCFWMAVDPNCENMLFCKPKSGKFAEYHKFKLYYVGYGANNNTTTRFRKYIGDGTRQLLPEHDLSNPEFMNVPNKKRKIQIISTTKCILYYCDGKKIFCYKDEDPYTEGWFAFRTVKNHMVIDNFKIYLLSE